MSEDLLFELGTEELPPSELPAVLPALRESAQRLLQEARLAAGALHEFATPRRLALLVEQVAERQTAHVATVTGPPRKAGFDAAGKPTRAAEGFARAQGVPVEALTVVQTERGEYLAATRHDAGRAAVEVLPALLERLVLALPFVKQMRWGAAEARFSRPVRWVVALLGRAVVPVRVCGVEAGRVTRGHRFLHPEAITLDHASSYRDVLRGASVIADVDERRQAIDAEIRRAVAEQGGRAVVDAQTLAVVVHLVEAPAALVGTFPEAFLDLPREVVETPIRHHQRCFTVEDPGGRLAPRFVAVSNMPGTDPTAIRRGHERVIRARLADADFYFREDLRLRPIDRLPLLKGMVFQERLGTLHEKTERLVALTELVGRDHIADGGVALRRAALLAKTDLASGMVREFPELQGAIGADYARRAGEPEAVVRAIEEQYRPRAADDAPPTSVEGAALGIADRVDTVVGCLGVGLLPTGSQDPYGLRRHAHGVVQIALTGLLGVSLERIVDGALALLAAKLTEPASRTRERALEVFRTRLATALGARGLRADVVEAVLAQGFDDPARALRRAEALATLMARPDWEPLVVTFKRTINILPPRSLPAVRPDRFVEPAERELHEATVACAPTVQAALAAGDYAGALTQVATLRPRVDRFFEAVMVMDKDPAIQDNRLALLRALADLLLPVGDLRRIQTAA
jgi:glycyl-tRNA synthetase beta chain